MAHFRPTEIDPELTAESLNDLLARFTQDWEESECFAGVKTLFEQAMTSDNVKITSCVCLGLGSLTDIDRVDAPWYELVTLIAILEILSV